jgi:hypothetical protein
MLLCFSTFLFFSSSNFQIWTADIEEGDGGEDGDGRDRLCGRARDTRETSVRDSDTGEREAAAGKSEGRRRERNENGGGDDWWLYYFFN